MADSLYLTSGPVLRATNIGKEYKLFDSQRDRFKALVTGRLLYRSHWSLKGVSFELARGKCLGVIGDNGAGKSTLLKILAGTLHSTTGHLDRVGRVTAILELGAGFHPDFTGRENLYFGGNLIGISTKQMQSLEESIVAFSELGEAIDRAVKTYSSGMIVRLAFALVTAVEPTLLIVDEALAVGDQHFQKKCIDRIDEFRSHGCSILFCSHSLYHVRQLCDQAIWLDRGLVKAIGDTEYVLSAYEAHVRERDGTDTVHANAPLANAGVVLHSGTVGQIESVEIANLGSGDPPLLESSELAITVRARLGSNECPNIALMLEQSHGVGITSVATHAEGVQPTEVEPGLWQIGLLFPDLPLHSGDYVVSAYLFDAQGLVEYDKWYHCKHFRFIYPSKTPGLVRLPHRWI
jgi:lipopolysaccharide transport system ATP-binding protein